MLLRPEEKHDGKSAELSVQLTGQIPLFLLASEDIFDVYLAVWPVLLILLAQFVVKIVEVGGENLVALTPLGLDFKRV